MRKSSQLFFWNLTKGPVIGYVESVRSTGVFFKHIEIGIRETSSKMANGDVLYYSLSKHDIGDVLYETAMLAMKERKPATFITENDFLGLPTHGYTGCTHEPWYVSDININNGLTDITTTTKVFQ